MSGYGKAALLAVEKCTKSTNKDPVMAWKESVFEIYPSKPAARDKGCPKGAFLGLCSEGLVSGIPRGNYTKSIKNSEYAKRAVEILRNQPLLAKNSAALWLKIQDGDSITHNGQLDVVISLWEAGKVS